MQLKNFEFKAKVDDINKYENKLLYLNPDFHGIDHQIDTYFHALSAD
jgi:adenylate cyclase, class 2